MSPAILLGVTRRGEQMDTVEMWANYEVMAKLLDANKVEHKMYLLELALKIRAFEMQEVMLIEVRKQTSALEEIAKKGGSNA